ncbi:MAG: eukaryotic-like serine/threonine-protein kinase [Solirubrobacteraceae bacterium]|jgi:serine/threonine-protein kinase|nr:eukaryotic-like serine/threonine-protein kinase [Solirubrobacteraceae bacterium]
MPLASQIELPERYRVARHIATGGMASVWEVEDLLLGRIVAVKVLGAQYAADPLARTRFQREARMAAQVSSHPHVVTIYDIGEHGDDAFIVMEHFSGGTVADRLRTARETGSTVDRDTALRWLRDAAAGLDVAHAAGIVHRDVKPANLLLDTRGRVAVADFGIARLADDTQMTQTGQVLGTAAYLSPEQALGRPATPASDRYALAVVAYELLSGQRPFEGGPPAAQLRQHVEEPPPRASEAEPELPSAVDGALVRGLAKDPDDRPATATEFVDELQQALGARAPRERTRRLTPIAPAAAPEPPPPPPPPSPPSRRAATRPTPPPSATPRPPAAPPPPASGPRDGDRGRGRRGVPLLAVLAVAAVIAGGLVGLALQNDGGGDRSANRGASSSHGTAAPKQPSKQKSPAPATMPSPPATAAKQSNASATSDPAALNDRGFQLIRQGDYAGAVQPLRASVAAYRAAGRTDELGYYFALFNLGVALNRSGNPGSAVSVLRERLRNPNQRDTVQRELDSAAAKLGGGTSQGSTPSDKQSTTQSGDQGSSQGTSQGTTNDGTAGYAPGR